ncbi:MAG: LEA type 2 family protein [Candidatus Verstraetearchaeota archaeon]|nr:LEA type 2 family protein [Candidatus Verstraetearchaeota archaeon]
MIVTKKTWVALVILVIAVSGVGIYVFSSLQQQTMENLQVLILDVQVQSVGLTTAKLNIKLNAYNPNMITITVDRVIYSLYGNNISLGNGMITEKVNLPPRTVSNISSIFEFSYSGAIQALWHSIISGEKIEWKVNGTAYVDTPLGALKIPFSSNISK